MTTATEIIYEDLPDDSSILLPEIKVPRGDTSGWLGMTSLNVVTSATSTEETLLGLRRAGLIRWSGRRLKPISPVAKAQGEKGVADLIIEDRG